MGGHSLKNRFEYKLYPRYSDENCYNGVGNEKYDEGNTMIKTLRNALVLAGCCTALLACTDRELAQMGSAMGGCQYENKYGDWKYLDSEDGERRISKKEDAICTTLFVKLRNHSKYEYRCEVTVNGSEHVVSLEPYGKGETSFGIGAKWRTSISCEGS